MGGGAIFLILWVEAAIRWTLPGSTRIMGGARVRGPLECLAFGQTVGGWERFWEMGAEWLVLWIAVLAVMIAIAYYVIEKIRPKPAQKEPRASQWLSKFRELHSEGELSDEEFRTIKTNLAAQLQDELNDNGDKG